MTDTPTPARPALDASLAKVKAFLTFDSFPSDEASLPTFEALRVVIDDYDRVVRSLADMRTALTFIAAHKSKTLISVEHGRGYSFGAHDAFEQLASAAEDALARSAP